MRVTEGKAFGDAQTCDVTPELAVSREVRPTGTSRLAPLLHGLGERWCEASITAAALTWEYRPDGMKY